MPKPVKINVLGPFQVLWSSGEPIEISSKKAQALLAYLAVEHHHPQSRETLANLLWAHTREERSRHNLRQALSAIRRGCDSLIAAEGDCLSLDRSACETDIARFETLAESEDPVDLAGCLDLYRGDLLDSLNPREPEYHDWLSMVRTRVRNVACQAASKYLNSCLEQGREEEAVGACRRLLAIDAAHEPTHRRLMLLLDATGRRSEALRQYQVCTDILGRELGTKPDADTRRVYEGLLKGDSKATPVSDQQPRSLQAASHPSAVAVMPFDNLATPEDAYFADGMAEDLITALSCFPSLVIIARGSSFAFRDSELTDREIAGALGAQYLVRGSVRRAGNHVRINVQLLDAEAGIHLWGNRYDREMEDVFMLQDEITATLVSTLAGRVEADRLARARKAPPERLDAYDLLLRGKDHHHRFTPDDCEQCIEMFERAIERDPDYAVAYAWLACGLGQAMVFGLGDVPSLVDKSEAAAKKGLALDENDAECHRVLAQVSLDRGNLSKAMRHQERALFLNPNDDRIVNAMGELLVFTGRAEEAENWIRKSMQLNPYHPQRYLTHLVRALYHQGRYDEALDVLDRIEQPRKDDLSYRAASLAQSGRSEEAAAVVTELGQQLPGFDPVDFAKSMPFKSESYRQALSKPLESLFQG